MIGHHMTPEQILDSVNNFWDLSKQFPLPRRPILCPVCREQTAIIRSFVFFPRSIGYRCDVAFKCTYCSAAWAHGLTISKEYYDQGGGHAWTWREALDALNEIDSHENDLKKEE